MRSTLFISRVLLTGRGKLYYYKKPEEMCAREGGLTHTEGKHVGKRRRTKDREGGKMNKNNKHGRYRLNAHLD